jgi:UDP-N-acetylglucosamine/UDP-N-acetyl-alpha-D-glucosaminouronate 4-epimerase
VELVEGDMQSYERVHNAVRGCEVHATNVTGTLNVLLVSRDSGVRRVVFASSSSVYGANSALPKQESLSPAPISPYAVSKLAGGGEPPGS